MISDRRLPGDAVFFHRESLQSPRGPIEIGFTDASLDLHLGRAGLAGELTRLEGACGVALAQADQVHGNGVLILDGPGPRPSQGLPSGDALVAGRRGFGLMTRVADCVPVLLVDAAAGVVAAVHSGRPGTALNVVGATVEAMRRLGATSMVGWIGPSICGGCYEVPGELRARVSAAVPGSQARTTWGTPSLDLAAGVRGQLERAGVGVRVVPGCTREEPDLHSYRRDGESSGRCAGVVWMP